MISVAMATYNGENFLRQQLLSILAQTRKPDEIIINDDASNDKTAEIVKEIALTTDIPILFKENEQRLGFAQNFRHAIRRARGDIIFLSDQDDIWLENKIELCMSVFEQRNDIVVLSTDFILFYENRTQPDISFHTTAGKPIRVSWHQFIRQPKYPGMAIAFRKNIWPQIDSAVWGKRAAHDWMINQYAASIGGMYRISNKTVLYRQHKNNTEGVLINKSKNELCLKRRNLILTLIDEMEHTHPANPKQALFLKQAALFQRRREKLLTAGKTFRLLIYELCNINYITLRSIVGDMYVCVKSARSHNE